MVHAVINEYRYGSNIVELYLFQASISARKILKAASRHVLSRNNSHDARGLCCFGSAAHNYFVSLQAHKSIFPFAKNQQRLTYLSGAACESCQQETEVLPAQTSNVWSVILQKLYLYHVPTSFMCFESSETLLLSIL